MKRITCLLLAFTLICCLGSALADRTVTLTFTGDITLGGEERVKDTNYSFNAYYGEFGPSYFLEKVRYLFQSDDITCVNLEGTLTDSFAQEDATKTYRFRAPVSYVEALTLGSVEVCNLANNHTMDFGYQGINSTRETLTAAGIGYIANRESWVAAVDEQISIGFLTFDMFTEDNRNWMAQRIRELRQEGVDAFVFVGHFGQEYYARHNQVQENIAAFAIRSGCDLVVMHHPHVVQGVDIINNRYVLYSLGNFCFGGNARVRALETCIMRVMMTFDDEGNYTGQQLAIFPANTSGTFTYPPSNDKAPDNNYQPVLVSGAQAEQVMRLIQADTRFRLNAYSEYLGCALQQYLPAK